MFAGLTRDGREGVAERVGDVEVLAICSGVLAVVLTRIQTPNHSWLAGRGHDAGAEVLRGTALSSVRAGFSSREIWIWYFRPPASR